MSSLRYLFWFHLIVHYFLLEADTASFPEMHIKSIHILSSSSFKLLWDPLETKDENYPIIGLKIKVWKNPCKISNIYHFEGEQLMKSVRSELQSLYGKSVPQELPEQVFIVKPDVTEFTVPYIDKDVWYHVRMLAFTKTTEGPYSDASNFKIGSEIDEKKSCEKTISVTPVEGNMISLNE